MNQRERINLIAQMRCLKSSWLGLGASNISVLLILLNVNCHNARPIPHSRFGKFRNNQYEYPLLH